MRYFLGNLSFRVTEEEAQGFLASSGFVKSFVEIVYDLDGRSRGFGFVDIDDDTVQPDEVISRLDGHILDGRALRVARATPRQGRRVL